MHFLNNHTGGNPEPNKIRTSNNERIINCFLALKASKGFYDTIPNYLEMYKD
ncbi:hypothetical protein J2Z66_007077 [Paenibacillus eucommiae]|uniref:Uncharacterized protein n=1 Tax=Paenibacillus eucommiae TaxID=1355755 RepID=A0ABS4J6H2_9BACL|nr:hypothetical protein [Paenibacillus eucommiae]